VITLRNGKITVEQTLRRYRLSYEQFLSWQRAFETYGLPALRDTRVKQYGAHRRCVHSRLGPHVVPDMARHRNHWPDEGANLCQWHLPSLIQRVHDEK
jgi:uncharacterized protein DUF1153